MKMKADVSAIDVLHAHDVLLAVAGAATIILVLSHTVATERLTSIPPCAALVVASGLIHATIIAADTGSVAVERLTNTPKQTSARTLTEKQTSTRTLMEKQTSIHIELRWRRA